MEAVAQTNTDEVLVKDKDGSWRVWRDGQWLPATSPNVVAVAPVIVAPEPVAVVAPVPAPVAPSIMDTTDALTERIYQTFHLSLPSPDVEPRLKNAIRLRLKDVRDTVDTREVLLKPVAEGGCGLSDEVSDVVIQAVLDALPEVHQLPIANTSEAAPASTIPSILYRPAAPTATQTPAPIAATPTAMPLAQPAVPTSTTVPTPAPARPLDLPLRPASMVDVRTRPAAVGPIDELKFFTILDFRRLDPDPKRAAARLKEKVKLLEDDSYEKMVDGIRAWRQSPLHTLYLSIGQESLKTNQPIARVIEARKTAGDTTLTSQEFETIMELNKNLRF